jgi:hypothetical protein
MHLRFFFNFLGGCHIRFGISSPSMWHIGDTGVAEATIVDKQVCYKNSAL